MTTPSETAIFIDDESDCWSPNMWVIERPNDKHPGMYEVRQWWNGCGYNAKTKESTPYPPVPCEAFALCPTVEECREHIVKTDPMPKIQYQRDEDEPPWTIAEDLEDVVEVWLWGVPQETV